MAVDDIIIGMISEIRLYGSYARAESPCSKGWHYSHGVSGGDDLILIIIIPTIVGDKIYRDGVPDMSVIVHRKALDAAAQI